MLYLAITSGINLVTAVLDVKSGDLVMGVVVNVNREKKVQKAIQQMPIKQLV